MNNDRIISKATVLPARSDMEYFPLQITSDLTGIRDSACRVLFDLSDYQMSNTRIMIGSTTYLIEFGIRGYLALEKVTEASGKVLNAKIFR